MAFFPSDAFPCSPLSLPYLSLSFTPQKVAFEFFKERGAIELQQKPRIADYWALMRSSPSLPGSRKHLMLFFFVWARRIDQASKKRRVGRLKKRRRGERKRGGGQGKGCRSFKHVCLTALCGGREEKRGGGTEGSRERDGERGSLKHCLYAGKFWTTLLTSKCFH